jgi:hypothetical protein
VNTEPSSSASSESCQSPEARPLAVIQDELVALAVGVGAATYRMLCLIRELELSGQCYEECCMSTAQWLAWRLGIDPVTAREKVRVAVALGKLPKTSTVMATGALSYSKVRAMTRVATPDNEAVLLEVALHGTTVQLQRFIFTFERVDRGLRMGNISARERRYLDSYTDNDGMVVIRARLTAEAGALFRKALEMAEDELTAERHAAHAPAEAPYLRQADALERMAARALSSGGCGKPAERYQVVLRRQADSGLTSTSTGAIVPPTTADQLACDATVVEMTVGPKGEPLDVGRARRTVTAAQHRALQERDGCCCFPGCDNHRWAEGHHLKFWIHGGTTSVDNLCHLCWHHHKALHDGRYSIEMHDDGTLHFRSASGVELPRVPSLATPAEVQAIATACAREIWGEALLGTWLEDDVGSERRASMDASPEAVDDDGLWHPVRGEWKRDEDEGAWLKEFLGRAGKAADEGASREALHADQALRAIVGRIAPDAPPLAESLDAWDGEPFRMDHAIDAMFPCAREQVVPVGHGGGQPAGSSSASPC